MVLAMEKKKILAIIAGTVLTNGKARSSKNAKKRLLGEASWNWEVGAD